MKILFFSLLGLIGLQSAGPTMAANSLPIDPFQARYTVYAKGIPLGEAVMNLDDQGNGRYSMNFDVSPNNVVGLFVSHEVKESARGEFHNGTVRPHHYEQLRRDSDETHNTQIDFDWSQGTLYAQSDDEQATLPLSARVVDPVSLYLLVMLDLRQGHQYPQYTFVDDTELKTYQVRYHGEETLKTPLGPLRTVRVSQSKPDSTRITNLWFAPELGYLPVQIAQEKKGKEVARMIIENVQGLKSKG